MPYYAMIKNEGPQEDDIYDLYVKSDSTLDLLEFVLGFQDWSMHNTPVNIDDEDYTPLAVAKKYIEQKKNK